MRKLLALSFLMALWACGLRNRTSFADIAKDGSLCPKLIQTEADWRAYKAYLDSIMDKDHDARAYHLMAQYYCARSSYDMAKSYADTSITLAISSGDTESACNAHWTKANCYNSIGNTASEEREWKAIIAIGLQPYADDAKERLAFCYWEAGRYQEALSALPDSLSEEGKTLYNMLKEKGL